MASSVSSLSTRFCFIPNNSGNNKPSPWLHQPSLSSNSLISYSKHHHHPLSSSQIPVVETDKEEEEKDDFNFSQRLLVSFGLELATDTKTNLRNINWEGGEREWLQRRRTDSRRHCHYSWLRLVAIKAYRPCPGFVEAGGRYRRIRQSMDEVAFGRGDSKSSTDS